MLFESVWAVQLPASAQYGPFNVTVTSYELAADKQHAVIYGLVRSSLPLEIRILSAWGTVQDQNGLLLGRGDAEMLPFTLAPNTDVPAQLRLVSQYAPEALSSSMQIQLLYVHAELLYCLPYAFWIWSGCGGPFTYTIDRTFTVAELLQVAQQYGLGN